MTEQRRWMEWVVCSFLYSWGLQDVNRHFDDTSITTELSHAGPMTQDNPRPPGKPGALPVRLLQRSWRLDLHLLANHLRQTAPTAQRRPAMPLRWECNREAREIHVKKSASRRNRLTRLSVPQW